MARVRVSPHVRMPQSECFLLQAVALAAWLFVLVSPALAEQPYAPGLCVIPVKNSTLQTAREFKSPGYEFSDKWSASFVLAHELTIVPGLSKPILYPAFSNKAWTISEDNTFKTFGGSFPSSKMWDSFAVETQTGRIVGTGFRAVYAYDPPSGQFRMLVPIPFGGGRGETVSKTEFRDVNGVIYVARLGLTLFGTHNGVFRLDGEQVNALPGSEYRVVGNVETIIDLPVHKAILLSGDSRSWLRHDDGSVELLTDLRGGWFSRDDQLVKAFESRQPGRIILKGFRTLMETEMRPSPAGFSPGRTWTRTSSSDVYSTDLVTKSGEFLIFGRTGLLERYGLERLEADGLHIVPGSSIPKDGKPEMYEIPSRGLVLIRVLTGLYVYDGTQARLILESADEINGAIFQVRDLPVINKVLIETEHDLLELTTGGRLEKFQLPFAYHYGYEFAELPSSGVGLIEARGNLYALDRSGDVKLVRGSAEDLGSFGVFAGVIPGRNAMILGGITGLYLVVRDTPNSACLQSGP